MLQQCELRVHHDIPVTQDMPFMFMPHNDHCDKRMIIMFKSLPGTISTNTAWDTKKDHFIQLANVKMPEKPHITGNLRKVLQLKIGAKIRLTTNINVSDGLTNGAMGSVSNIIIDEQKQKI